MTSPLVSVIIPTYNSENTLKKCLESLKNQTYTNLEIIVIDNNSYDNTKKIALQFTKKVFNKGPERTTQKNYGIEKSNGEYLIFIDSDMELESEVIKSCISLYSKDKNIGGICIPERSIGEGLFVKIRDFERSFYEGTSIESARFFKSEDVKSVGGFEEDLIFFEESILPQKIEAKLGKKCTYRIENHINHNEGKIKLFMWLRKKFYYGKSLNKYKKLVHNIGIKQTGNNQIGIIKRYCIFLKNKKFKKIIGKFDNFTFRTAGEDSDLKVKINKIGLKIKYCENVEVEHIHSFEKEFGLLNWLKKEAQIAEAEGVLLRKYSIYKLSNPIDFIMVYFRQIIVLLFILIIFINNDIYYLLFLFILFFYSFIYTKLVYFEKHNLFYKIILPFINIFILFLCSFYSLKGFIKGKQIL